MLVCETSRFSAAAVITLSLLVASPLLAEETARTSAREIAKEGLRAYDKGNYKEAEEKLGVALKIVEVPTLALYVARAQEKLGKLVEASETYLYATRLEASGPSAEVQKQARDDATREREALLPRIPSLVVEIEGAAPDHTTVEVDGTEVPLALLGAGHLVNPGTRRVLGKSGEQTVVETAVFHEGERITVTLRFSSLPASSTKLRAEGEEPKGDDSSASLSPGTRSAETADSSHLLEPATHRLLGWAGVGLGGAGLLFGGVSGIMALSKKSELEDNGCVNGHCYTDQADDVDSYDSMVALSTAGFVVGGLGAIAGISLLLTAPEETPSATGTRLTPWIGLESAGVVGTF